MKPLLTLLLSLLCLTASASPGQPYFVRQQLLSSSVTPPSVPELVYWWVSSDLSTNFTPVSIWADRLHSSAWTNTSGSATVPTNTPDGVYFHRAASQVLSNVVTFGDGLNYNSSHWIIVKRLSSGVYQDVLDVSNDGNFEFGFDNANRLYTTRVGTRLYYGPAPATNTITDICLTLDGTVPRSTMYTNGVAAGTNDSAIPGYFSWKRLGGLTGCYLSGYVLEIGVWSNAVLSATSISNLHYYATNTYHFTP